MISAIGSDVATWPPPPPSYDMHCRTHGSGLVSLGRHRKEWMGPQGRPYAAKERLRRWVMEKIGAPGFAAARYSSGLQRTFPHTRPCECVITPRESVFRYPCALCARRVVVGGARGWTRSTGVNRQLAVLGRLSSVADHDVVHTGVRGECRPPACRCAGARVPLPSVLSEGRFRHRRHIKRRRVSIAHAAHPRRSLSARMRRGPPRAL